MMEEHTWKIKCDEATSFLESCFDENNEEDNKSFDERVKSRLNEIDDETVKNIVRRLI